VGWSFLSLPSPPRLLLNACCAVMYLWLPGLLRVAVYPCYCLLLLLLLLLHSVLRSLFLFLLLLLLLLLLLCLPVASWALLSERYMLMPKGVPQQGLQQLGVVLQ
jgi:hypothetical protein